MSRQLHWSPVNPPTVLTSTNLPNKRALSDWRIISVTDSQPCQMRFYVGFYLSFIWQEKKHYMILDMIVLPLLSIPYTNLNKNLKI